MPKFFFSSTKQEFKTCVLLGTSSGVTTLLGVTNFSGVMILKTYFLSGLAIFFCPDVVY